MKAKLIKHEEDYYCLLNDKGEVIADVNGGDILKLSLRNCQAIKRGYDLDVLAENWVFTLNGHKWSNNDDTAGDNYGSFMAGAKTILAIFMDKKFTEEDVKRAIFNFANYDYKDMSELDGRDKAIQSLQKNEWDVEIEMEPYHDGNFEDDGKTHSFEPKWRPILDEDGCLILRLA